MPATPPARKSAARRRAKAPLKSKTTLKGRAAAKRKTGKKPAARKAVWKKLGQPLKPDFRDPEVRAALKERNLARMRDRAPALVTIIENHKPLSKLVVHEDGQIDIAFEGEFFYNEKHDEFVAKQLSGFWINPQRMKLAPLQPQYFDETAGLFIHNILKRGVEQNIDFHVGHHSDESYFLYVMGLGLGGHILELIERTKCKALAIVEPNPEFLVHSLEVFDWSKLFDLIDKRGGLFTILINNNPMALSYEIRNWLRVVNPLSVDGSTCYVHYNNPVFNSALKKLIEDRDLILTGLGFFYDESLMIKNTHHNLYSGKERVYLRPVKPRIDAPAFVIGNGPSLDDDLDFIRENQDKAIIISSGSALRPLILNGIVPDFQMETENIDVYPLVAQVAKDHDISSVALVTSTTVDIKVPPLFDTVLYYFRGSLSPYPIFCDVDERCLQNPNPTVVNASLSFAQELGFRKFYFFGTDMGTKMGAEKHHSKHAYQYTKGAIHRPQSFSIPVAANFGGTCMTSDGLYWTRDAAEKAISQIARGRFYFNCSNGAKIAGTIPTLSRLVKLPELPAGKKPVVAQIMENFKLYDRREFDGHWNDKKMIGYFNAWLDAFEKISLKLKNFDDLSYLTNAMNHMRPTAGRRHEDWGPALLFRGTLLQILMAQEYYLRRLAKSDVRKFEKILREEMAASLGYLRETAIKEFSTLSRDAAAREKKKTKKKTKVKTKKKTAAAAARV